MTLDEAIERLREVDEEVPRPLRAASESDLERVERALAIRLPESYRRFQLGAGHVTYGTLEPATVCAEAGHTELVRVARDAWASGVPASLLPICEDNGDYYCLAPDGRVVFWSHNGTTDESWPDLAAWVERVWLDRSGPA
jgi:hypothetical protein